MVVLNWQFTMMSFVKLRITWCFMNLRSPYKDKPFYKNITYMLRINIEIHQKQL